VTGTLRGPGGAELVRRGDAFVVSSGDGSVRLSEADLRWLAVVGAPAALPPRRTPAEAVACRRGT
jgi:hypothetical protein